MRDDFGMFLYSFEREPGPFSAAPLRTQHSTIPQAHKNQVNSLCSFACVRAAMANERNAEVCQGEEQAGDEAGTRDQRREGTHKGDAAAGGVTRYAGG